MCQETKQISGKSTSIQNKIDPTITDCIMNKLHISPNKLSCSMAIQWFGGGVEKERQQGTGEKAKNVT